jgi:uncharacterized RDD family membrane protein YckC
MMSGVSAEVVAEDRIVLRRYLQYGIDRLLTIGAATVTVIALFMLALLALTAGWPRFVLYVPVGAFILVVIISDLLIDVWIPLKRAGSTPGMLVVGLRIVAIDGRQLGVRDYLLRWLLSVVDGLFLGLLGALLIALTPRHQRMGDIVARTLVVRLA